MFQRAAKWLWSSVKASNMYSGSNDYFFWLIMQKKKISSHYLQMQHSFSNFAAKYASFIFYDWRNHVNRLYNLSAYTHPSCQPFIKTKKPSGCRRAYAVTRMGFEPMTPTLKVLCSTNWASESLTCSKGGWRTGHHCCPSFFCTFSAIAVQSYLIFP